MKARLAVALSLLLAGSAIQTAAAHSPSDPEAVGNIGRLSASANLIFRGKVTSVRYRNSRDAAKGAQAVPYTFVTY
jgi:hypothetical protein